MKLLLDTHALLWWTSEPRRLSAAASAALSASENDVLVSVVTPWEVQIKIRTGKLTLPHPIREIIHDLRRFNRLRVLSVRLRHVYTLDGLPDHHRDPFDRMLVAQATCDGLTLVTCDPQIVRYPVATLW